MTDPPPSIPRPQRCLAPIVLPRALIAPSEPAGAATERFQSDPLLDSLPVGTEGELFGVVFRSRFLARMTGPFGHALLNRRAIAGMIDQEYTRVQLDDNPVEVVSHAASRDNAHIWDDVIVFDGHDYCGVISMRQLMTTGRDLLIESVADAEMLSERQRQTEELHRGQTEFVANMTHELRAPLNAVLGIAQLIVEEPEVAKLIPSECAMLLSRGRELRSLVDNLLELHKVETGNVVRYVEQVDVRELLRDCVEQAQFMATNAEVELAEQLDRAPIAFDTDPVLLRRIVVNLLSNGLKFTDAGSVVLTAQEGASHRLLISVQDTGAGIAASDLPRLFTKFTQLEATRTKRHSGTGLGLAIVRSLTEILEGTVSVASELGKGSTFTVELPRLTQ